MATIKTTWRELRNNAKLLPKDVVAVQHLNRYGFDDEIINGLIKYDLFPQSFHILGVTYVRISAVLQIIHGLVRNSLRIYADVAAADEAETRARELIEQASVRITPEDIEQMRAGTLTLEELAARTNTDTSTDAQTTEEIADAGSN